MRLNPQRSRYVLLALTLLLALAFFFIHPILRFTGSVLIAADELRPAGLVAVISGALPEIRYGLDLCKQGFGDRILFVGHYPVELAVISEEPFDVVIRPWEEIAGRIAVTVRWIERIETATSFPVVGYPVVVVVVRNAQRAVRNPADQAHVPVSSGQR